MGNAKRRGTFAQRREAAIAKHDREVPPPGRVMMVDGPTMGRAASFAALAAALAAPPRTFPTKRR